MCFSYVKLKYRLHHSLWNSWRRAFANARPITWPPRIMIWATNLAYKAIIPSVLATKKHQHSTESEYTHHFSEILTKPLYTRFFRHLFFYAILVTRSPRIVWFPVLLLKKERLTASYKTHIVSLRPVPWHVCFQVPPTIRMRRSSRLLEIQLTITGTIKGNWKTFELSWSGVRVLQGKISKKINR